MNSFERIKRYNKKLKKVKSKESKSVLNVVFYLIDTVESLIKVKLNDNLLSYWKTFFLLFLKLYLILFYILICLLVLNQKYKFKNVQTYFIYHKSCLKIRLII